MLLNLDTSLHYSAQTNEIILMCFTKFSIELDTLSLAFES